VATYRQPFLVLPDCFRLLLRPVFQSLLFDTCTGDMTIMAVTNCSRTVLHNVSSSRRHSSSSSMKVQTFMYKSNHRQVHPSDMAKRNRTGYLGPNESLTRWIRGSIQKQSRNRWVCRGIWYRVPELIGLGIRISSGMHAINGDPPIDQGMPAMPSCLLRLHNNRLHQSRRHILHQASQKTPVQAAEVSSSERSRAPCPCKR